MEIFAVDPFFNHKKHEGRKMGFPGKRPVPGPGKNEDLPARQIGASRLFRENLRPSASICG
jgi:hypothetical protein